MVINGIETINRREFRWFVVEETLEMKGFEDLLQSL